jgi:hypothetical protein
MTGMRVLAMLPFLAELREIQEKRRHLHVRPRRVAPPGQCRHLRLHLLVLLVLTELAGLRNLAKLRGSGPGT